MPSQLIWIPTLHPHRLAIMPRPRGGDWLEDDLKAWKMAGADHIVSLLTLAEMRDLDLSREEQTCVDVGLEYISHPIPDRHTPASMSAVMTLSQQIETGLKTGEGVVIHCRMGIGRASMIAACVMAHHGIHPSEAFKTLSYVRGVQVPDTDEQRQWVERYAKQRQS